MIQVMKVTNGTFNSKGSEPEAEESLVQEAKRLEEKYALTYSRQTSASLETLTLIRAVIEEQKDQAAVQRRLKLEERERERKRPSTGGSWKRWRRTGWQGTSTKRAP